jgi:hypothetical protein
MALIALVVCGWGEAWRLQSVMAGLDPAIHVFAVFDRTEGGKASFLWAFAGTVANVGLTLRRRGVDGRDKPGHDDLVPAARKTGGSPLALTIATRHASRQRPTGSVRCAGRGRSIPIWTHMCASRRIAASARRLVGV